jgi:GT2 family glycosyltransferase
LLDDDDEYLSSFLQSTYEQLNDSGPTIGFSWCGANIYDYGIDGGVLGVTAKNFITDCESNLLLFEQLFSIGTGYGLTIKSECIKKVGVFDEGYRVVEDTDFFLRLLTGGFYPRIIPGVHIALHNQHLVRLTSKEMHALRIREGYEMLKKYESFFDVYPSIYKKCLDHLQFLERELGQVSEPLNA